jgi:hypothetical protein
MSQNIITQLNKTVNIEFVALKPLYDLVICSRKIDQEGRILWLKIAGEPKSRPAQADVEISHPAIMALLAGYELVKTDRNRAGGEIVRKYRRLQ